MIGAPPAFAGVVVALLILMPETVPAVGAARRNDLQKSINLALGSSLATIGLTVPAVAVVAYTLDKQLMLGLNAPEMVLLLLTSSSACSPSTPGARMFCSGLCICWCSPCTCHGIRAVNPLE